MPNDDTQSEPRSVPYAAFDPVYRQIVAMVEPEEFDRASATVYALLDDLGMGYKKLQRIPELGAVPIELARGEDVAVALGRLNASDDVKVAEQNQYFGTTETLIPPLMSVNDPLYRYQWALFKIGAEAAWAHPATTTPVVVAILDTGISTIHPDLATRLWNDGSGNHGFNVLTLTNDVEDEDGHGTLLAGTIAAVSNDGVGIAGTLWPLKLMAVKFHDARTRPNALNALYAIAFALINRANVITAAWHLGLALGFLRIALQIADALGVVFVAGAGNDGLYNDVLPTYPASYNVGNVIGDGDERARQQARILELREDHRAPRRAWHPHPQHRLLSHRPALAKLQRHVRRVRARSRRRRLPEGDEFGLDARNHPGPSDRVGRQGPAMGAVHRRGSTESRVGRARTAEHHGAGRRRRVEGGGELRGDVDVEVHDAGVHPALTVLFSQDGRELPDDPRDRSAGGEPHVHGDGPERSRRERPHQTRE